MYSPDNRQIDVIDEEVDWLSPLSVAGLLIRHDTSRGQSPGRRDASKANERRSLLKQPQEKARVREQLEETCGGYDMSSWRNP